MTNGTVGVGLSGRGRIIGVRGDSDAGTGVVGGSTKSDGVFGEGGRYGVRGTSASVEGVRGDSQSGEGVHGETNSNDHAAVVGIANNDAQGGWFQSNTGEGLRGTTNSNGHAAVVGIANGLAPAVFALANANGEAVHGETSSMNVAAIAGFQMNGDSHSAAIYGKGITAGHFEGNVEVTGDITLLGTGHDFAEDFDISDADKADAGTVMVLNQEGAVEPSHQAYDKKAAGVISGAGGYRPGIVLGRQQTERKRMPIALMGKVYCKVDAKYSPIGIGDLLTTSETPGHAMKADDPLKAFGAVIGKALHPLKKGQGLIPILIALQ
jgi:hypothetical protein